jgi:hypothetical protein
MFRHNPSKVYTMKTTVDFNDFRHAFNAIRPDNFSREGLEQLFDYFESYEQDTGEEIELDVIAICCEYSEQPWQSIASDYDVDVEGLDDTEAKQHVMNYLCDNTSVIGETADGFVYQCF